MYCITKLVNIIIAFFNIANCAETLSNGENPSVIHQESIIRTKNLFNLYFITTNSYLCVIKNVCSHNSKNNFIKIDNYCISDKDLPSLLSIYSNIAEKSDVNNSFLDLCKCFNLSELNFFTELEEMAKRLLQIQDKLSFLELYFEYSQKVNKNMCSQSGCEIITQLIADFYENLSKISQYFTE